MERFTEGMVEGEMRQRVICNSCGASETVSVLVPPDWQDDVKKLIVERPERYWDIIRDRAFQHGWYSFRASDNKQVDLCPRCMVLLRKLSRD